MERRRSVTPDLVFHGYRALPADPADPILAKWRVVHASAAQCPLMWSNLTLAGVSELDRVVNSQVRFVSEPKGISEWQTSVHTWTTKQGDCKDYATLKYDALLSSGVPEECLRVVVGQVKRIAGNLDHAWCAAYIEGAWRALDNNFDRAILVSEYINWLPIIAVHADVGTMYSQEFTIHDVLARPAPLDPMVVVDEQLTDSRGVFSDEADKT